eukprot:scaffold17429_cov22-Tisochrysis_lutea.AAC.5
MAQVSSQMLKRHAGPGAGNAGSAQVVMAGGTGGGGAGACSSSSRRGCGEEDLEHVGKCGIKTQ